MERAFDDLYFGYADYDPEFNTIDNIRMESLDVLQGDKESDLGA